MYSFNCSCSVIGEGCSEFLKETMVRPSDLPHMDGNMSKALLTTVKKFMFVGELQQLTGYCL